jgi:predicted TIM-barrel fold metal-dependent hydrolase
MMDRLLAAEMKPAEAERFRKEHDIKLSQWRPASNATVPVTRVPRARFPVINVHNHFGYVGDEAAVGRAIREMDAANIRTVVNLTGLWGTALRDNVRHMVERYPGRFVACTMVDFTRIDEPDFSAHAVRSLDESYRTGARCLKVFKILGLTVKDKAGSYVAVNDPRLDPIWAKAGQLKIPVLIHVADPIAFFRPWDENNEAFLSLFRHPEWYFHGEDRAGVKRFTHEELMQQRNDIVARHPGTTFVALHYASLSHDLGAVGELLDRFPNLLVEMGARNWALGAKPNSGRKFAIKYQDRILFGTDGSFLNAKDYENWFRTLETDDDLITAYQPWGSVFGVHLPDEVLRKIYNGNAKKIFPFLQ